MDFFFFFIIGDFMNLDGRYEDIMDIEKLRKHLNDCLEKYNNSPGVVRMDLVLFRDAIEHSKIYFSHLLDKGIQ